jgi:calcineurin-like phosphoesterase
MLAIVFFGVFQHEVALPQLRRLVAAARSEAGDGCVAVCCAGGLFAGAPALESQIESLFESGIDLVFSGEQAIARNAGRQILAAGRWPIVRPLNLPDSAPGRGALLFDTAFGPLWMVAVADGTGKVQVEPAHLALERFFGNKKDQFPVVINVNGTDFDYKKALSWKYGRHAQGVTWYCCGSGQPSSCIEVTSDGLFLADTGSVVADNTINGIACDIWWKRNIEKFPVSSVPGWGCFRCDYSIVWFDEHGKTQKFVQKSLKV